VSTILELIEQGKTTRLGAVLADLADDLRAALDRYDVLDSERAGVIADRAEQGDDASLSAYDETIADLNERGADLLETIVAILRAEG
jgi:hypothetical protein